MPKTAIIYENTIIYKIVCKDLTIPDCYVGHTTNWIKRKSKHKMNCITNTTTYVYQFIREHGGWDNWQMVMVEKIACDNIISVCSKEREWIEKLNAKLNMISPPQELPRPEYLKEYRHKNTEKIKQYYVENADKIKENVKKWTSENAEHRKEYMKEYMTKNTEKKREYDKMRYAKSKLQKDAGVSNITYFVCI
jgi:hypothetical protein